MRKRLLALILFAPLALASCSNDGELDEPVAQQNAASSDEAQGTDSNSKKEFSAEEINGKWEQTLDTAYRSDGENDVIMAEIENDRITVTRFSRKVFQEWEGTFDVEQAAAGEVVKSEYLEYGPEGIQTIPSEVMDFVIEDGLLKFATEFQGDFTHYALQKVD